METRIEFKNDDQEVILIVNDEKLVVSEEIMSRAFRYFHEIME